jgi:PAS domain S-box-containing protein
VQTQATFFRRVVEAAPNGMMLVDRTGKIVLVNEQMTKLFGYDENEFLGQPVELLVPERFWLTHEQHRRCFGGDPQTRAMGAGRELFGRRKDGSEFPVEIGLNPILTPADEWVLASIIDITERKQTEQALRKLTELLEERVQARTKQVQVLVSELLMAEQRVQQRIAQVLHDDLQQLLYSVRFHLYLLRQDLPPDMVGSLPELVAHLDRTVANAIDLTRQLSVDLAPPVLDKTDLIEGMQRLVRRMKEMYGLDVTLQAEARVTLPDELCFLVYQIVRELLFNVVKHAGVSQARVTIVQTKEALRITVEDEGQGFEMTNHRRGYGLSGLGERLGIQGGRLQIDSAPGCGTRIFIELPQYGEGYPAKTIDT